MTHTRRELTVLFSALAAGAATANAREEPALESKCYPFDGLPVKTNPTNHNETRNVFSGSTHDGYHMDLHITTLASGQAPHPPHTHIHEEMVMLQTGSLDVTISGVTTRIGPGSVAVVKSNELHGWKNAGDSPAQYFVLAVGRDKA